MVLEYDWESNAYRSRFDDPFPMLEQSFETLAAARLALRVVGLRLGAKTDPRSWQIELMEPFAERAGASTLPGPSPRRLKAAGRGAEGG